MRHLHLVFGVQGLNGLDRWADRHRIGLRFFPRCARNSSYEVHCLVLVCLICIFNNDGSIGRAHVCWHLNCLQSNAERPHISHHCILGLGWRLAIQVRLSGLRWLWRSSHCRRNLRPGRSSYSRPSPRPLQWLTAHLREQDTWKTRTSWALVS